MAVSNGDTKDIKMWFQNCEAKGTVLEFNSLSLTAIKGSLNTYPQSEEPRDNAFYLLEQKNSGNKLYFNSERVDGAFIVRTNLNNYLLMIKKVCNDVDNNAWKKLTSNNSSRIFCESEDAQIRNELSNCRMKAVEMASSMWIIGVVVGVFVVLAIIGVVVMMSKGGSSGNASHSEGQSLKSGVYYYLDILGRKRGGNK